jgi:hypothetical protein
MGTQAAILEFEVPDLGRKFSFTTSEQVLDWANQEIAAWKPLAELKHSEPGFLEAIRKQQMTPIYDLRHWSEAPSNEQMPRALQGAQQIGSGIYVHSSSPLGQHILSILPTNPSGALLLLNERNKALDNQYINFSRDLNKVSRFALSSILPAIRAANETSDSKRRRKTEERANADLRRHWGAEFQSVHGEARAAVDETTNALADIRKQAASQTEEWKQFLAYTDSSFKDAIKTHKDALEAIEKEFIEQMRLRAASTYWKAKEEQHAFGSRLWLGIFTGAVVVLVMMIAGLAPLYLDKLPKNAAGDIGLSGLAAITLPVVLILWALRHVSRLFVTHNQQREDARQRRALVTTYLALIHKGAVSNGERMLILHALFRPNAMKDDDDPGAQSIVEALAKQFQPKA